jgi:calcyphosin
MDDDNSGDLDFGEFYKGMKDYRIQVSETDAQRLFTIFDINKDGVIVYDEFLRRAIGPMSQFRQMIVKKAFNKFDKDGNGVINVDDLKGVYDASCHPDVRMGRKTEDEVLSEFLDTFELNYSLEHPQSKDRVITLDEFIEYYNNISVSIDDDRYFEMMMNNAWKLDGKKTYQKGWATQN